MKNDLGKEIVQTFNKLSTERQPYEQIWREAFEFSFPLRGQKFNTSNTDGVSTIHNAQTDKSKLVDSTGKDAARLLAASMLSGLTPSNSQWFNLTIPNSSDEEIDQDAKEWLEDSAHKLFQMIHAANYDSEAYEFFLDMVVGGMCGLYVEHADSGGFSFEFWPLDSLYCKDSLKRRKIDTIFRIINVTPAQAIDMFGNNLPEAIKSEYTNNPDCTKTFQFIHAIRPRMKGNKQSVGKINKTLPWESVYVCKKTGMIVKESGYHEFPVVVPRWLCIPDSDYAVGPFDDALPDVKSLNYLIKLMMTNAEMAIAGTFVAKSDGVINPATVRIGARRIVFAADTNNIKPLASGGDFGFAQVEIERLQRQIRKVMLSDQLQPQDGPAMTATEVHVRVNLIRQLLGPIYGRFQSEFLQPLIVRAFGIAFREGYLGTPPESMSNYEFIPAYQSPLATAQKQEDIRSIQEFEASMASIIQIAPEILDLYDFDAATRKKAELLSVPIELFRKPKDVNQIRSARQQQQAQQPTEQEAPV